MKLTELYNQLIQDIVDKFAKRYYKEEFKENDYHYEIIDYQGIKDWPIEICDEYYSIDEIITVEHHNIPIKVLRNFYDLNLATDWKPWINLYNYWKQDLDPVEYEKERLDQIIKSEKKVKEAENIFLEELKKYDKVKKIY